MFRIDNKAESSGGNRFDVRQYLNMTFYVLFIDSYDSFTYNVVELIKEQREDIEVVTIHNDTFASYEELKPFLRLFDAIVVGPGPGNPVNGPADVGIVASLFNDDLVIPILGICLGFQVMCHVHGATIEQLDNIRHGQVYPINVKECGAGTEGLFSEYPSTFDSVRYHSLHVICDSESSNKIVPLAYTLDEGKQVLMAGMIAGKPWYGVQYHPESCCSKLGGKLIQNFIKLATNYNQKDVMRGGSHHDSECDMQKLSILCHKIDREPIVKKTPNAGPKSTVSFDTMEINQDPKVTLRICEALEKNKIPFFLLASSTINPNRGEMSIIALPNKQSKVFTHYAQLDKTTIHNWQQDDLTVEEYHDYLSSGKTDDRMTVVSETKNEFWKTIGTYMDSRSCPSEYPELPFVGGFVGILGYEMGQFTVSESQEKLRPDAKLCFVENSILINHKEGKLYTIGLNCEFPSDINTLIKQTIETKEDLAWPMELPEDVSYDISLPKQEAYEKAFELSQKYLHQGDSYEVCLTTQTNIKPSKVIEPWRIFQTLIQRNPAPFSSFFMFDDVEPHRFDLCLISTSPERFLKYSNDTCELRPIKGTVKKGPDMDLEKATAILKTPKEFGENLMILDLIRNDLYEVLPKVTVDEMMSVEEYATVYQLVSVVSGHKMASSPYSGLDVLKHSLPPGSMTGAPKKKTVELLQERIEPIFGAATRGVYSGVTGYWSANMNGDWSVNIRCMYSYDEGKNWRIGAGGAITVLSTCEGEWEEMFTKLESALQVFTK